MLLRLLLDAGLQKNTSKQSQHSIAQCVAVLCCTGGAATISSTISNLLATLNKSKDSQEQRLSLLCVGEVGRRTDLSGQKNVEPTIMAELNSADEEVKSAASTALGGVVCGNLGR